jgi:hypothetical protein
VIRRTGIEKKQKNNKHLNHPTITKQQFLHVVLDWSLTFGLCVIHTVYDPNALPVFESTISSVSDKSLSLPTAPASVWGERVENCKIT